MLVCQVEETDSEAFLELCARVESLRAKIPEPFRQLIVGPVKGVANGYAWFAFFPDGSKEGWSLSAEGDQYRDWFEHACAGNTGVSTRWGDERPCVDVRETFYKEALVR